MMSMRSLRILVLAALALKATALVAWWWDLTQPAWARAREGSAKKTEAAESAVPAELLARSRGFRDLLAAVEKRTGELDQREQTVAARESALKTLERAIADELTRLEAGGRAPASAGAATAGSSAPPAAITKIYENMKAEEAAPIIDRLDDATARAIMGRMKEKQIAAILAAMNRDRAVALTKMLTGQAPPAATP
jgi:flagellar motility protein MotE (MotC chaperone)